MYEMLTGEVAFTGPTAQAVIAKRFAYSPPAITDSRPRFRPASATRWRDSSAFGRRALRERGAGRGGAARTANAADGAGTRA